MRTIISLLFSQTKILQDNFEGNNNFFSWFGSGCLIAIDFNKPLPKGSNTSTKVFKYADIGGQYANVGFNAGLSFNLLTSR